MTLDMPVTDTDSTSKRLKHEHDILYRSFRQIASTSPWCGIPPATLCAIYHGKIRVPNKYRKQLGLPQLVKVPENMVRKTQPAGTGRKRAPRVEIALSDPDKARARLEQKLAEYHIET